MQVAAPPPQTLRHRQTDALGGAGDEGGLVREVQLQGLSPRSGIRYANLCNLHTKRIWRSAEGGEEVQEIIAQQVHMVPHRLVRALGIMGLHRRQSPPHARAAYRQCGVGMRVTRRR